LIVEKCVAVIPSDGTIALIWIQFDWSIVMYERSTEGGGAVPHARHTVEDQRVEARLQHGSDSIG
jgi:hypothetical protein